MSKVTVLLFIYSFIHVSSNFQTSAVLDIVLGTVYSIKNKTREDLVRKKFAVRMGR